MLQIFATTSFNYDGQVEYAFLNANEISVGEACGSPTNRRCSIKAKIVGVNTTL